MSKIFENTIWLSSEKLIRLGGGLILSVLTAKYLGPEQFGLFNFIVAFTAFFQIVTGLGYEATLVKYLIDHPEKKWKILSTSIWMRLMSAVAMLGLSLLIIPHLRPNDSRALFMAFFFGLGFVFQILENIDYWFQSRQEVSKIVTIRFVSFLLTSCYRIWLIVGGFDITWFAISFALECLLNSLLFLYFISKENPIRFLFHLDRKIGAQLLERGYPMIFSLIFLSLQTKIDQLMIGLYLGDVSLGYYSVAFRIYEVLLFFPTALASASFPKLISLHAMAKETFKEQIQFYFNLTFLAGLITTLLLFLFSEIIIRLSFGDKYIASGEVLSFLSFSCIFGFWGAIANPILLVVSGPRLLLLKNLFALFLVLILNALLIRPYGIFGACFALIAVSIISNFLFNSVFATSRFLFFAQLKAVVNFFNGKTLVQVKEKSKYLWSYLS